jgi:hypothetical protein
MAPNTEQVEKDVEAELGERGREGLLANACSRVCGLLRRDDWDKAFEHISKHFSAGSAGSKPSHGVFCRKYRDKKALGDLLYRTASAPSSVHLTKLTIAGDTIGKPAVEIRRVFGEAVGEDPSYRTVRVFVDYQGNLITAYPDNKS